jgi:hypothetical protein
MARAGAAAHVACRLRFAALIERSTKGAPPPLRSQPSFSGLRPDDEPEGGDDFYGAASRD